MRKIESIAIVGGGSSGWMTAAYFSRLFPDLAVTLVESTTIPVIGVGEATVPLIQQFMARIGYPDPHAWIPACDATLKTGIVFENWKRPNDRYWHPFDALDYVDVQRHVGHCWLYWNARGDPECDGKRTFYRDFFPSTALNAEQGRAPSFREYAFHFDAFLFGEFLRAASPSVRHVLDDVVDVPLDERGEIAGIRTAEHGVLEADLYFDCTGFRRLLARRVVPAERFESYAASLFCDRALVMRMPYPHGSSKERLMPPYVRASARSAGWNWAIPLYGRLSTGYVYSSAFIDDDAAERELKAQWTGWGADELSPLRVKFETGKQQRLWAGNCIAIGLAGGFIEPLESTGLAITQLGIELAASVLDARCYDERTVERYNVQLDKFYTDIMHFIIAHYCLTEREDTPFWRAVKFETVIPEHLQARFETFRRLLPTGGTKGTTEVWMFKDVSWFAVLLGMEFGFDAPEPPAAAQLAAQLIRTRKRETVAELAGKLPNHYRFLRDTIYGRE